MIYYYYFFKSLLSYICAREGSKVHRARVHTLTTSYCFYWRIIEKEFKKNKGGHTGALHYKDISISNIHAPFVLFSRSIKSQKEEVLAKFSKFRYDSTCVCGGRYIPKPNVIISFRSSRPTLKFYWRIALCIGVVIYLNNVYSLHRYIDNTHTHTHKIFEKKKGTTKRKALSFRWCPANNWVTDSTGLMPSSLYYLPLYILCRCLPWLFRFPI